jgi:outer membrane phospholipase A
MRVRVTWYRGFGDVLNDTPGQNDGLGIGFALPIGGPPDGEM